MNENIKFTYMKTPLYRYTFKNKRIRKWVENNAEGKVLNLFAGKYKLACNEVRNDIRVDMPAHYHMDALEFVKRYDGDRFDTVVLDPPYALRKSMEMYDGAISSPFNKIKDTIKRVMNPHHIVITFGYHSVSMGKKREYRQEHILLLSHGGAIHDTIAVIERKDDGISREEVGAFF
jgi:23S rRNA G2069 N7-methylase RlmK/C1962 C5-methylase RlmI